MFLKAGVVYELCQNTPNFSREMNGIFFVYKKFEIVKYIWYNKTGFEPSQQDANVLGGEACPLKS